MTPKAQATKAITTKWDQIKLKSIGTAKEIVNKRKNNLQNWGKKSANHILDKGQNPQYIKNLHNSIAKTTTTNNQILKWTKQKFLNRNF